MKWNPERVVAASPQDTLEILYRDEALGSGQLIVMHLNTKRELAEIEYLALKNIHARSVFNKALKRQTAAVVLAHGRIDCLEEPNEVERATALEIANAGMLTGIPVSDYIIVGYKTYYSFSEHGLLPAIVWDAEKRRPIWRSYAVTAIG